MRKCNAAEKWVFNTALGGGEKKKKKNPYVPIRGFYRPSLCHNVFSAHIYVSIFFIFFGAFACRTPTRKKKKKKTHPLLCLVCVCLWLACGYFWCATWRPPLTAFQATCQTGWRIIISFCILRLQQLQTALRRDKGVRERQKGRRGSRQTKGTFETRAHARAHKKKCFMQTSNKS